MGYETYRTLQVMTADGLANHPRSLDVIAALRDQNEEAAWAFDGDGDGNGSSKWYEMDNDITDFSKQYPDALLVVDGEGEDTGDLWRAYFLNGKMQYCPAKIEFDEFNPARLA